MDPGAACHYCKSGSRKVSFCGTCFEAAYCGAVCQSSDWGEHRKVCGRAARQVGAGLFGLFGGASGRRQFRKVSRMAGIGKVAGTYEGKICHLSEGTGDGGCNKTDFKYSRPTLSLLTAKAVDRTYGENAVLTAQEEPMKSYVYFDSKTTDPRAKKAGDVFEFVPGGMDGVYYSAGARVSISASIRLGESAANLYGQFRAAGDLVLDEDAGNAEYELEGDGRDFLRVFVSSWVDWRTGTGLPAPDEYKAGESKPYSPRVFAITRIRYFSPL